MVEFGPVLDTGDQQKHPGDGAGQKADREDNHDRGHQEHGSLQFGPVTDGLLPEPVGDVHGAVDQNDERDNDLGEEDCFSHTVHDILNQGILTCDVVLIFVTVAAVKVFEHGGDGERQQEQPYEDRDVRGLLESPEKIFPTRVDHVKVPIDGRHRQESDAGSSVQKQHEEHSFANRVILAPPLAFDEVVGLNGQAEEQENVCQHQVEQEDVVGVGFPKLQLEYEEMEDRCVQRQSQDENDDHESCVELVQMFVGGLTVFNGV